jgi:hypothetical protein
VDANGATLGHLSFVDLRAAVIEPAASAHALG